MWCLERGAVTVRPSRHADVLYLKDRLRGADIDEVRALTGQTPEEALIQSRAASDCCQTVLFKGSPVAMFGTAPMTEQGRAGVWFLASDELQLMWLSFLKMSRECVARMLNAHPLLFNYVDARNAQSIAWLTWCGAKLEKPKKMGTENRPFHFFTIKKEN
jgi:hypothetical protein